MTSCYAVFFRDKDAKSVHVVSTSKKMSDGTDDSVS